jgi:hypothetical protein
MGFLKKTVYDRMGADDKGETAFLMGNPESIEPQQGISNQGKDHFRAACGANHGRLEAGFPVMFDIPLVVRGLPWV